MASNVTRDHHNLRRNLKLNGNYISNDGGDEAISINDDGDFHVVSSANTSDYCAISVAAEGVTTLSTTDSDGSTGGHMTIFPDGDLTIKPAGGNVFINTGSTTTIDIKPTGDTGTGAGFRFHSILDTGDYFNIDTTTHGATTITTVDDDAEAGDLTFNIDGYIDMNSASGEDITLDSGGRIFLAPDDNVIIDRNTARTATGTERGLYIDYDHTGISASGQTVTGIGLDLDMNCETVTHVGAVIQTGIDIDIVSADDGIQTNAGIDITTSGGDKNFGIKINNEDNSTTDGTEADLINYSSADNADYFYMNTEASGVTTLGTIDSGGTSASINLAPNGKLQIHAGSGANPYAYFQVANPYSRLRMNGYNQTDDYLQIDVEADGATIISTVDDAGMDADLTLDVDGDIVLDSDSGYVYLKNGGTGHGYLSTITGSKLKLGTSTNYELLLTTAGTGDIVLDAGGHVEFDGCAVGFDRIDGVFDGTNSTVDFRTGNKAYLDCTGTTSTNLKITFPDVSGNFVLLINHPASGCNISNYLAYDSGGVAAEGDSDVKWAGGTAPTLTNDEDHVDILSFFWDADTEIAYGVASLDFQN